jgi:RNA polymerase sigma-70 factor (ECF subfamily)
MTSLPNANNSPGFCTTHWTTVLNARDLNSSASTAALEKLCQGYWFPLYAYARRKGLNPEDAQDAVQGFFAALLEKHFLNTVDRDRGKFRTFLLTAFNRFLLNLYDHQNRLKRGGATQIIEIDAIDAEKRYLYEPADSMSPDKLFDRKWAQTVVRSSLSKLEKEYAMAGELHRFELLKPLMMGHLSDTGYRDIGTQLGLGEGGVKTVVRRMRLRFSTLLREELLQTLAQPQDTEEELKYLLQALA